MTVAGPRTCGRRRGRRPPAEGGDAADPGRRGRAGARRGHQQISISRPAIPPGSIRPPTRRPSGPWPLRRNSPPHHRRGPTRTGTLPSPTRIPFSTSTNAVPCTPHRQRVAVDDAAGRRQLRSLVFVGGGPRTVGILERLAASADQLLGPARVDVHIVDPFPAGGGRIWRSEQSALLWMNSMARDVTIFTDSSVTCEGPIVPGPDAGGMGQRSGPTHPGGGQALAAQPTRSGRTTSPAGRSRRTTCGGPTTAPWPRYRTGSGSASTGSPRSGWTMAAWTVGIGSGSGSPTGQS